jgi:hypothetical protein
MRIRWLATSALAALFSLNASERGEAVRPQTRISLQSSAQTAPPRQQTPIKWRDVFHIDIADPVLRRHVEGFLTYLETADYPGMDPQEVMQPEGQSLLFGLKRVQDHYREQPAIIPDAKEGARIDKTKRMVQHFEEIGLMRDGKFIITAHNLPYVKERQETGTHIVGHKFINFWPAQISLGTDYMKGARYRDERGGLHAVTVDAALIHQFAPIIWMTEDKDIALHLENDYLRVMGMPERADSGVVFKRGINGGYRTLYDRKGVIAAELVHER